MNKIIILIACVVFSCIPTDAKVYISRNLRNGFGADYVPNPRSAEWPKAIQDCKTLYGENASLVNLETPEELQKFKEFIESAGDITADSYWLGGRYNGTDKAYHWATGEVVGDHIQVEPYDHPTRLTRLAFVLNSDGELKFKAFEGQATTFRYICEKENDNEQPTPPPCSCP